MIMFLKSILGPKTLGVSNTQQDATVSLSYRIQILRLRTGLMFYKI